MQGVNRKLPDTLTLAAYGVLSELPTQTHSDSLQAIT